MKTSVYRAIVILLASSAIAGTSVLAESLPLMSVNKANEVIDAAVAAHGGADALSKLHTLVQETKGMNVRTGQSRAPGPPYDKGVFDNLNAIDTENEIFANRNSGKGGGYVFKQGVIIDGENSWQLNYLAATAAPIAEPDYTTQSGPFIRVTPALLMKQLQARRGQSNWLGEVDVDGKKHDVITLIMEVGPALALYFDQETHMLTRMERALPPFGQIEYRFENYAEVGGIPFNQTFRLLVNGESNLDFENVRTEVNAPLDEFLAVPGKLEEVAAVTPDEPGVNEIADGVFLAGGNGTYSLFVEVDDYLVAAGGTQIVADALALVREEGLTKPVKYGVVTHHHSDHVPGAAAYAAEGATVVASAAHEQVVRRAAGEGAERFEFVAERMSIGNGKRMVEIYDIGPTPHAEHILLVHIPDVGVIFEADHFPMPLNGTIPPAAPATAAFAGALKNLDIDYRIIAGTHSPRTGTPRDVKTALKQKVTQD